MLLVAFTVTGCAFCPESQDVPHTHISLPLNRLNRQRWQGAYRSDGSGRDRHFPRRGGNSRQDRGRLERCHRRTELVVDHMGLLKAALPDASFAKVDAYVRTPLNGRKSLALPVERNPTPESADKASAIPAKKK